MVSKSADDTLATLKDVLNDISHIYNNHLKPGNETGIKILSQIKNTMSDQAATESKFNELLKTYRSECMDKCIDGWDSFSVDAQEALNKMNNQTKGSFTPATYTQGDVNNQIKGSFTPATYTQGDVNNQTKGSFTPATYTQGK